MGMKEYYQEKADAQLYEWRSRIDRVKADPGLLLSANQAEHDRAVRRIDDCYHMARLRLDELRVSQEDRWELSKQAVERALIDLKKALDDCGLGASGMPVALQKGRARAFEPFHRKG